MRGVLWLWEFPVTSLTLGAFNSSLLDTLMATYLVVSNYQLYNKDRSTDGHD